MSADPMPPATLRDRAIVDVLSRSLPDLIAVYRFGSSDGADERNDSDIDVAFLAKGPKAEPEVFALAGEIATALGREVDLVDLARASTVMRAQVVSTGRRILTKDPLAAASFETVAYSAYAILNEERAGILEDIQARGSVHAG